MKGISASPGIAIGKAFVISGNEVKIEKSTIDDINKELYRLNTALEASILQLDSLLNGLKSHDGETTSIEILEAHSTMLSDIELISAITTVITSESVNAEYAVKTAIKSFVDIFENLEDDYLKERSKDILDIGNRIISNLSGSVFDFSQVPPGAVIVTKDLYPSETVQINKVHIEGVVTEESGRNSHTAIIARTLGIPTVCGISHITSILNDGDIIIVDGMSGEVIINPEKDVLALFMNKKQQCLSNKGKLDKLKDLPAVTIDGTKVRIEANIGSPDEMETAVENGAQGIGLFRTEFLYMGGEEFPTEDAQFNAYKKVVAKMCGESVTIRTLDVGGDKDLPYFGLEKEDNPFLGFRAIRVCFEMRDMFKTQLKAILRASMFGSVRIMYPMITDVSEVLKANKILEEAKDELRQKRIPFSDKVEVGIMIETPAAAMATDILAQYVDFFSIGTNDLTQYALAADRGNVKVKDYYNYFNTGVVRLIKNCIDQAHKYGKYIAMCGEMASDPDAVKLLLGLGLDVFSMRPAAIPEVKDVIRHTTLEEAVTIAKAALK